MYKTAGKRVGQMGKVINPNSRTSKAYELRVEKLVRKYLKLVVQKRLSNQDIPEPPVALKNKHMKTYSDIMRYGAIEWAKKQPDFKNVLKATTCELFPEFNKKKNRTIARKRRAGFSCDKKQYGIGRKTKIVAALDNQGHSKITGSEDVTVINKQKGPGHFDKNPKRDKRHRILKGIHSVQGGAPGLGKKS